MFRDKRGNRTQEVIGSIPFSSAKFSKTSPGNGGRKAAVLRLRTGTASALGGAVCNEQVVFDVRVPDPAEGWKVLTERPGPAGAMRFVMQYDPGHGDYTKGAAQWSVVAALYGES